ncbi:MAG: S8 family serine peptidase [Acidimicrobiales bacterium]
MRPRHFTQFRPRLRTRGLALGVVAATVWAAPAASAAPPQATEPPQSFIVVLEESAGDPGAVAAEHARTYNTNPRFVYRSALKGYSTVMDPRLAGALAGDPRVAYLEPDAVVRTVTTQSNATWGLDRIDQRTLPLDTVFSYARTGAGVKAYVIDTGIRASHEDFGGRVSAGFDALTDGAGPATDCNGHGTHVAGTVGGLTYGGAKSVNLVPVKVLDCSGQGLTSVVIAGVDWVTADHQEGQPAVANMSLGGGASPALDAAVKNSIIDGVSYAIAAGNGDDAGIEQDACGTSPARVAKAMTISATASTDAKASWANYGSCVDWFAPGVAITSAWWLTDTSTATISGTSMAAPHTAAVAALYLQANPSASPATVRNALFNLSTKGIVTSARSANNHLLFKKGL